MYWPHGYMWSAGGWIIMLLMMLFWLLLLAGIVLIIIWAIRRFGATGVSLGESPLDILKKRYARGEISREDYERMKQDLS